MVKRKEKEKRREVRCVGEAKVKAVGWSNSLGKDGQEDR